MSMESQEMIAFYEEVAVITDRMLAAARAGEWEQLVALEARCSALIAFLKTQPPSPPLTGEAREQKIRIIKKILADDCEIRNITEPWMAHLAELINSSGAERKLHQAYGTGQSG